MGRYTLILVAGFAIIAGLLKMNMQQIGRKSSKISFEKYETEAARSVAHSAGQLALEQLKRDLDWRDGYSNLSFSNGTADVNIVDSSTDSTLGPDTIRVESQGSHARGNATVILKVALGHPDFPDNITSGITANSNVGTLGNMNVDGRDHDMDGNLISDNGVLAIKTTETYYCGGSTSLAGTTESGTDYGPVRVNYDPIVEEDFDWPGIYPRTPEEVLGGIDAGLPNGILKSVALSGINGSQYTHDPTTLTFPLNGVTYVELPYRGEWNPVDFGDESSGILVVHNSSYTALMKNLNEGIFRGFIVADDMVHIHATIIGGVFLLSRWPSEGNCIGNGSGDLLFSRTAIIKSLEEASIGLTNVSVIDCWE